MRLALEDTIAAVATPIGVGGVGIVRLSGPQALTIAASLFRGRRDLARNPRSLCHGWVLDPQSNERVDEVLAVYMPAPGTYTRQDVVEIDAHGGPLAVRQILSFCLRAGARAAEAGEMTLRAFVNGRIDLTQAEAVRGVVEARTEAALRQAVGHLEGRLGTRIRQVRRGLLECLAVVEAAIDFDEEEAGPPDLGPRLAGAVDDLTAMLAGARAGIMRREGVHVAIVGRPNVGKSSLMNAILGVERAIVTPIPGTTRDTLEEAANVNGVAVVFVDTAGLAGRAADAVEQLGMERARQALARADVVLLVLDASQPLTADDAHVASQAAAAPGSLVVWNKCDLPTLMQQSPLAGRPEVRISALTGEGLPTLEERLLQVALAGAETGDEAPPASERQRDAVARGLEAAQSALAGLGDGRPLDALALDLKAAADALGEVTGETAGEELLTLVFSSFCVGK